MMNATDQRAALVRRWHDLWSRIEMAHGPERDALLRELRGLEGEAMALIRREQEGEGEG